MKTFKKQKTLRPTTGKVREALFDILRGKIENTRFLDLYAGTGAVGIDALNEGAAEVVFVEESKGNAKKISEFMGEKRLSEKTAVITKKVLSFIDRAELNRFSFDIIFLDPPYHTDEIMHVLSAIEKSPLLKQKGIVIAEHFAKKKLPEKFDGLQKVKEYNYGDTVLSFYEKR
ncbi:MAG TPA: 16S rRNA (guanine(966)-N(2))-methyltransferase RsmD [Nitrospirae bacterium]|nr:ribosomal RNA small subunit methyltransferase D [bacterium BMS3Abin06]GBE32149.1 ribosomal RNA small subunit methyltransferase D [bacterium BMS3Bbin05]HDH11353.1 16S rRNA (guanine(966)-N(2))-methyltransferase RsmD [Nitrospirota bacterium]HDZ03382.1 16S rRNA (guanine(966)-N(2))-methyltransferase RsmD [Nitrospirota bacterium]